MERFWELCRRTKAAVRDGSLSLTDAADRLTEAARADNPTVLTGVASRFPGRPERELMILMLLEHFAEDEKRGALSPDERDMIACQRAEFENPPKEN